MLLPLTFHRSHGLNEIDLARFGSQRSRPVLDHPPVENPLDRRRRVAQDPTLQRGVGAVDGLHHGGDDVDKMLSKKFTCTTGSATTTVGLHANSCDSTFSHGLSANRTGSAQMVGAPVDKALGDTEVRIE